MTSFSKSASPAGILPVIDVRFQAIGFCVSGVLAALAVSATFDTNVVVGNAFPGVPEALVPALTLAIRARTGTFEFAFHALLFAVTWITLFLPFAVSLAIVHLALPGLHRNARRLGAFVLSGVYVIVCLGVLKSSNPAWNGMPFVGSVPSGSLTLFQFLKSAFFTLAMLGICVPFVLQGGRDASRALRLLGVISVFLAWVALDWRISRSARDIGVMSLSNSARLQITLVVPDTTQEELLEALSMPEAQGFKERLVAVAPVLPVSTEELPQMATLLTGLIPPEHGIRNDAPLPESLARIGKSAMGRNGEARAQAFSNPGMPHATAQLFDAVGGEGRRCTPDVGTRARIATLEASPFAAALLPAAALRMVFPFVRCSQRFAALEVSLAETLDDLSALLRRRESVDAWISFRPHPRNGWQGLEDEWQPEPTPVALLQQHAHRLAGGFQILSDTVQDWGLWPNTEVWIVGLGKGERTLGAFSIHSGAPQDAAGRKALSGILTTQVELSHLLRGAQLSTAPEGAALGYTESPLAWNGKRASEIIGREMDVDDEAPVALDAQGIPRLRADWQRTALARSTRGTLCRVERTQATGAKQIETLLVTIRQARGAAPATLETSAVRPFESRAPLEKSPEDCVKNARTRLVSAWSADLDLPPLKWDLALRAVSLPMMRAPRLATPFVPDSPPGGGQEETKR